MRPRNQPVHRRHGFASLINLLLIGLILFTIALVFRQIVLAPSGLLETQGPNHGSVGRALTAIQLQPLTQVTSPVDASDLQGKVTVINFWGTWCPPCVEEMPRIIRMGRIHSANPDFQLWLVSCGSDELDELRETTADYLKREGWANQATYHDIPLIAQQQVAEVAEIPMDFPTTLVVDRHGVIRGIWGANFRGATEQLAELVAKLLAEQED